MRELIDYITAFPMGFALGSLYFACLWLTVRQLPTARQPWRIFLGGYIGRIAIALIGIYLITNGNWGRSLVSLVGFALARTLFIRRLEPKPYHEE